MSAARSQLHTKATRGAIFWIFTVFTALFAIAVTAIILNSFLQSGAWQYLALAAYGGIIIAAHAIGWLLAYKGQHYRKAIWLISVSQIIGVIYVTLFIDGYWMVGPFLLILVPFEIALIDDLRRVPAAIVVSLLGAAGMLIVDLFAQTDRLRFLLDVPEAPKLIGMLLLTQFIIHIWMLWHFRLRYYPEGDLRLDLITQLAFVFTGLAGLTLLVVSGVFLIQIRNAQIGQVGQNFQSQAMASAERIGNNLSDQIDSLMALGWQNSTLQFGLESSNDQHTQLGKAAIEDLRQKEINWISLPDTDEFVLKIRNNSQSIELSKFRGVDLLHSNLMLIDRLGGLVASQGERPEHFYYGEEDWFQKAWNDGLGGIYIGDLKFNPKEGNPTVFIAVGTLNPQTNKTSGVIATTYSLGGIQREIRDTLHKQTGEIAIITEDGLLVTGANGSQIGNVVRNEVLNNEDLSAGPNPNNLADPGWLLGNNEAGQKTVLGFAPLTTSTGLKIDDLRTLKWLVIVQETQAEAMVGVTRSIKVTTLVGVLMMLVVVAAAALLARLLTRPIEALTVAAVAASEGDLDQRADPVGPVELVALAEAFNALASHLQSLINSLQKQVEERTAQLQLRADQLSALNRITSSVASAREMQTALDIVAYEMVALFNVKHAAIALLDKQQKTLRIAAEFHRNNDIPILKGSSFRLSESPTSNLVIERRKTINLGIADIGKRPADRLQWLLQQTGTFSVMVVPLLARGEAIGTIDITCSDRDRSFTIAEIELAENIAIQIAGAIDNARLFSEMVEAKETAELAKEAAEAANAAKSTFLANVSHELRTPLTSVMGFARIVQKRLQEKVFPHLDHDDQRTMRTIQQVDENLAIIVSEGARLTNLINNVLDLSKIEAGKIEWNKKPVSIKRVVEHAVAATTGLLESNENLEFRVEIPADLPKVLGDSDRLIQVMINLISNAIKFTEQGTITCKVEVLKDQIQVSVTDTGIGISEDDQVRIFEEFIQLGDTLTEKPPGTGLGLPITKEIVELHGGRIWLESQPGIGSRFIFILPVIMEPADSPRDLIAGQMEGTH